MKYLEALKEKVAEMELKVLETQNEKNFYKSKYQEMEDHMVVMREKEKEAAVHIG